MRLESNISIELYRKQKQPNSKSDRLSSETISSGLVEYRNCWNYTNWYWDVYFTMSSMLWWAIVFQAIQFIPRFMHCFSSTFHCYLQVCNFNRSLWVWVTDIVWLTFSTGKTRREKKTLLEECENKERKCVQLTATNNNLTKERQHLSGMNHLLCFKFVRCNRTVQF